MDSRVSTAQKALGIAIDYYNSLEGIMNLMAKKIIKQDKKVNDYLKVLFPDKENSENKRAENVRMQIKELYATHEFNNMKGIKDSAWALYNSVVQYVDYERASRGKDTNARMNNRLNSIWIGNGARLKDKAFRAAVELFVKK